VSVDMEEVHIVLSVGVSGDVKFEGARTSKADAALLAQSVMSRKDRTRERRSAAFVIVARGRDWISP